MNKGEGNTMIHIPHTRTLCTRDEGLAASLAVPRASVRRRKRRSAGMAGLLAAAAALVAAWGVSPPEASAAAKVETTSFSLWESHNGGPVGDAMSALVAKFDRSQKQVHVTIDVTKASTKLLAAVAAGDPPVLAEISHYDGTYVKGHALLSWNSLIKGDKELSESNFVPAVWQNGEVGGQRYRLQTDAKVSIVDYNKTLFQKAGILMA